MKQKEIVWIIDAQLWPRAFLRAELEERGYEAEGFEEIGQAVAVLLHKGTQKPALIILELCDQILRKMDLDNLLFRRIPVIALGGSLEFNDETIANTEWAAVFRRPFSIDDVCRKAEQILENKRQQYS